MTTAHDSYLTPRYTDAICTECGCNMDEPRSVLDEHCEQSRQNDTLICVACCAGEGCDDCSEAIGTHFSSYRSQRDPKYPDTHKPAREEAA